MDGEDLDEVIDTLREQALRLDAQYDRAGIAAAAKWEEDRPGLKELIGALSETRDIMRREIKARSEALAAGGAASQVVGAGVTTGFNVIQSRAGQDGKPLPTESLMAERDRLVEALATLDAQIGSARRDLQALSRTDEQELCESRLIILQDTRRMYQDEVDMMEIELLGRERAERLAAERAAAEASGRAELARMQDALTATEQKLDIAKKRLYFPAAKGYGMSFGSNGIYVGGKDTFISELTGNWSVKGEVFPQGIMGNPGPVPRVTVTLGMPPPVSVQRSSGSGNLGLQRSSGSFKSAQQQAAAAAARQAAAAVTPESPLKPASMQAGREAEQNGDMLLSTRPSAAAPDTSPTRSPLGTSAGTWATPPGTPGAAAAQQPVEAAQGSVRQMMGRFEGSDAAAAGTAEGASAADASQASFAAAWPSSAADQQAAQQAENQPARSSSEQLRVPSATEDPSSRQPIMGLPPRDPRSKSKNMAMKLINKIGTKQPKQRIQAPQYPGEGETEKGKSLASRLLSKKASRRTDKLTFGSNAQGMQRRGSALPSFSTDVPLAPALGPEPSDVGTFAPQATVNGHRGLPSTDDLESLGPQSARNSEADDAAQPGDDPLDASPEVPEWPDDDAAGGAPALMRQSTGADSWEAMSSQPGGSSDRGSDGQASTLTTGRRGMFAALRIEDLGVIGEKGTKVPNVTVAEINIELEFQMTFILEYDASANVWSAPRKAKVEMVHLDRTVRGNNVPLPRTLLRFVLNATLPRIIQRRILRMLPPELGRYLLDAGTPISTHGEIGIVGPALSALDAHIGYVLGAATRAKDARRAAQHAAAAQEARSMLGLTQEQAGALAELFGGRHNLLGKPKRACIADLIAFFAHRSEDQRLWPQLCTVWDAGLRAVCQAWGVRGMPPFAHLMEVAVAGLGRKPVRARFQMHRFEAALNVDALLGAARDYFERVTREYHAKGPGGGPRQPRDVEAAQSLEVQLAALAAWETYIFGRLKTFKSRFRKLSCTAVGGADAERFSIGAEEVNYEGPLQLRLQVPTPIVEGDGAFSFHIPLPNPKGPIRAFLDRVREVLSSPLPPHYAPHLNALVAGSAAATADGQAPEEKSVLQALQDLGSHFGREAGLSGETAAVAPAAAPGEDAPEPPRQRIGKMIVNRMRVRVRLNEQRLAEMLRGMDPASLGDSFVSVTAGLLHCIGDVAALTFVPVFTEDGSKGQYLVCLESSDISNVCADLQALGFQSAQNPGRMIRVLHTLVRTVLVTFRPDETAKLAMVDKAFETFYSYVVRDALDVSLALSAQGRVEDNPNLPGLAQLFVHLGGVRDDGEVPPVSATNDIDLVTLYRSLRAPPEEPF